MFALSQLVDIPYLLRRLDVLPNEIALARCELWAADIQVAEAEMQHDELWQQAYDEYTKEHSDAAVGEAPPFILDDAVKRAHGYLLTMQEAHASCVDDLDNLINEMSTLRMKIDLITALTLGRQETSESVLLRRLLQAVRSVPGQTEEVILDIGYPEEIDPDLLPGLRLDGEPIRAALARAKADSERLAETPNNPGVNEAGDDIPF